jgi:hypothetical protein
MLLGGHGPFRGLVAPLALYPELTEYDTVRQLMTKNQ